MTQTERRLFLIQALLRERGERFELPREEYNQKRLLRSLGLLALLMYLSMGHNMAHFPVPAFLENHVSMAITQMLLALWVMYINRKFFTSGFGSLRHGAPNMDTLVAMGSGAAFIYSLAELYLMSAAQGKQSVPISSGR